MSDHICTSKGVSSNVDLSKYVHFRPLRAEEISSGCACKCEVHVYKGISKRFDVIPECVVHGRNLRNERVVT